MATLMPEGKQSFTNSAGSPLVGGKLYTYDAGTSNPRPTYQDSAGLVPNTNPIILDARGETTAFWSGSYKIVLKDASDVTVWSVDGVTDPATTLRSDLASPTGSAMVGHLPASLVATTVRDALRQLDLKTVNVHDYVLGGLGTSASPWTGWDTAIAWSPFTQYDFIDGYYSYATSPNFGLTGLKLNGRAGTVIRHTGAGYAMKFDSGPLNTDLAINVSAKLRVEANAGSTGGVYSRGISHSEFDIDFHNIPGVCFTDIFSVCNTTKLKHTALVVGATITPTTLINIEKRNVGELSSANVYHLIAENCSSVGVALNNCLNSVFISGTSENNFGGIFISTTSQYNTFLNFDFESNGSYDINCLGAFNNFIGGVSSGTATFNGLRNTIRGGLFNIVNSSGAKNVFDSISYAAAGGAFTDTGTGTIKRDVYGITAGTYDSDVVNDVSSVKTKSGSVSALNATPITLFSAATVGRYEVFAYVAAGAAALYTASATVLTDNVGSSRIIANNGTNLTLTLSGQNVQTTETSGADQTVFYNYLKVA